MKTKEKSKELVAEHSKESLRTWLRMLSCETVIEQQLRTLLRENFSVTLPQFDVLSELDSYRRAQVLDSTTSYQQVVISCTDLEPMGEEFLARATCYSVLAGEIRPL